MTALAYDMAVAANLNLDYPEVKIVMVNKALTYGII